MFNTYFTRCTSQRCDMSNRPVCMSNLPDVTAVISSKQKKLSSLLVIKVMCDILVNRIFFFFVINIFFIFSHNTWHPEYNKTRHILNISRSNQKGGREGRTIKTQKSLLYTITYIKQKTLPSINGRRPGPTDSRRCTFT